MRRAVSAVAALLFVVLAAASFAQPQGLTTVRVASNTNDDVTPLLYAQHAGLFAQSGLQVEIAKMNSGAAVTAGVIGGSLDVGKASLVPLIGAYYRKLPITIVSPGELWLDSEPISALVVAKRSTIASARDLSGKTVAVQALRDLSEMALRNWIDAGGGESNAVKVVEVPQDAILGALDQGRVDAANMTNPGLATALASNTVKVVARPNNAVARHFLLTAWFTSTSFAKAHPDVVRRFAAVMSRAARYTNSHHAETVPLTAPFWGIEPDVLAHMPRATIGETLDPRDIQPVIDLAAKYNVIGQTFDARQLIDQSR